MREECARRGLDRGVSSSVTYPLISFVPI